jgi:hypothetical protein
LFTERDKRIIEYIELVKCVNSRQIQNIFNISQNVANRRLLQLSQELKKIKKKRNETSMEFIYFINDKPTQHKLLVSEFYSRLIEYSNIIKFKPEYTIGDIRSDAFIACQNKRDNLYYYFFLEVQLAHEKPNIIKYEKLLEKNEFMPRIVVVSNNKWKYDGKLTVVGLDVGMDNFEEIFKNST